MFREHFICFNCRKSFRRNPERSYKYHPPSGLQRPDVVCPDCGQATYQMGSTFKAPKRSNLREWKRIASFYERKPQDRQKMSYSERMETPMLAVTSTAFHEQQPPRFGLDGTISFHYGNQQLWPAVNDALEPMLYGEHGQIFSDLPTPTSSLMFQQHPAVSAQWKTYCSNLNKQIDLQADLFQKAMLTQQLWSAPDVREMLEHPIQSLFVRCLLWIGKKNGGQEELAVLFHNEQGATDEYGQDVSLDMFESLRIAHPVLATSAQRVRWAQMLSDFAIRAPFPQLLRPVYSLDDTEHTEHIISAFKGKPLQGIAKTKHWQTFIEGYLIRFLYNLRASAVFDKKTSCLSFVDASNNLPQILHQPPLPLAQIDPVLISEVLGDLVYLED